MKKICIPTDFSANGQNAIEYAIKLYKKQPCEFFILHSYYLPGFSKDNRFSPEPTNEKLNEVRVRAEKNMDVLKTRACFNAADSKHTFHFLNEFGPFYEALTNLIEREDIALVIMGTRGETDNKNVIIGSNAVNVMEKVRNCPVMVIPSDVSYIPPNEIVFPTSFKTHYKQRELATLIEISNLTHAPIRILHIKKGKNLNERQIENKALLNEILAGTTFTHHTLFNLNLQQGVRCFAQSRASEMIAFINKKHKFFDSIFSHPMVKDLGDHIDVPVLALHDLRN